MQDLSPPDSFYVRAAKACLEGGKHIAAQQEFDRIAPELCRHPAVLEVRWAIQAHCRHWEASLEVAQALIATAPERPTGWIAASFVLHRLKRTAQALNSLFPAAKIFCDIPIIPYNLACYATHLKSFWEAERWFKEALAVGGSAYKSLALSDRELEPLWKKIAEL